jgi:cytochrome c oxidase subunit 3
MNLFDELVIYNKKRSTFSVNPYKFALWLFMGTIVMMFVALTSAYIVKQSYGDWLNFKLPNILWLNSLVIIVGSITMHLAYFFSKKKNIKLFNLFIFLTFLFSMIFLFGQYEVWKYLIGNDIYFVGNPSGSFLYIFIGLHGVHFLSGIIILTFIWFLVLKNGINKKVIFKIQMCITYWHFLGGLWLYLFFFLIINH